MFFEVLVLATKDAIQVVQNKGFQDITISPKQGLWGTWAEEKDEQQVAEEMEQQEEEEEREREREVEMAKEAEGQRRGTEMVIGVGRATAEGTAAA